MSATPLFQSLTNSPTTTVLLCTLLQSVSPLQSLDGFCFFHGTARWLLPLFTAPVDKISVVKKNLASTQVHYENNVAFFNSPDGPALIVELEVNHVQLHSSKITSVKCWNTLKEHFGLSLTGTLAELRKEASRYLKRKEEEYALLGHEKHQVNFSDKAIEVHIQAITFVDRELVFLEGSHSRRIHSAQLKYDGFGLCAINVQCITAYEDDWDSVVSLCKNNNKLFVSHNQGITLIELASCESQVVYKAQNARCTVAPFQNGIILTDQVAASLFKIDWDGRVQIFAGTKVEGSQDGLFWNASSSNQLAFVSSLTPSCMYATHNQTH